MIFQKWPFKRKEVAHFFIFHSFWVVRGKKNKLHIFIIHVVILLVANGVGHLSACTTSFQNLLYTVLER